jgi:probable phosphoglycerate mutase
LLVWRHGRTEWNATGRFQGQLDAPLDAEGRAQAARIAPQLIAAGLSADDTVVVSSDLSRAVDTAAALTERLGVPARLDPRLREHGLGAWEGLTRDEVAQKYPDQYADWVAGRPVRGRGGEDPAEVVQRALAALADLPAAAVAVVVTHGGTAGRLIEALLGLGDGHRRLFAPLGNCAWSELTWHGERWRLVRHNSWVAPPAAVAVGRAEGSRRAAVPTEAVPPATSEEPTGTPEGDADAVV